MYFSTSRFGTNKVGKKEQELFIYLTNMNYLFRMIAETWSRVWRKTFK